MDNRDQNSNSSGEFKFTLKVPDLSSDNDNDPNENLDQIDDNYGKYVTIFLH